MYLPLYFKSDGMNCLMIGGGEVALRKIEVLLKANCNVTVLSPQVCPEVHKLIAEGKIAHIERSFQSGDCIGKQLVVAATEDNEANALISEEARGLGVPVNVVDVPELCSVIFPAVERDEPLMVAVSTSGSAPFMAAELRNRLRKSMIGWGRFVEIGKRFRLVVRTNVTDLDARKKLYNKFTNLSEIPEKSSPPDDDKLESWIAWLDGLTNGS